MDESPLCCSVHEIVSFYLVHFETKVRTKNFSDMKSYN